MAAGGRDATEGDRRLQEIKAGGSRKSGGACKTKIIKAKTHSKKGH